MNASLNSPACSVEELQKLCDTLALQHAEVQRERDDFARLLTSVPRSSAAAEKALLAIRQARDTLLARNHELLGQLTVGEDRHAELLNQHEDLTAAHHAAMAELQALRRDVEELRTQPRSVREPAGDPDRGLVAAMGEMGRQLASMTEERDGALTHAAALDARAHALESERDGAATEATASRSQIEALVADRDALREQFKVERATLHAQIAQLHCPPIAGPASYADVPPPVPNPPSRKDPGLAALHKRLAALAAEPGQIETLEHFGKLLTAFALRSQTSGLVAAHRLATAAADHLTTLRRTPAKIAAALPALTEALAVLDRLGSIKTPENLPDPSGACVYAVDDDMDNCECVSMAFEKLALPTKYAVRSEAALADFASTRCDLILLDVEMPGMNGFALQQRLRAIEHHRGTPIIFVSGHLSAAQNVAALGADLHRFVAKPYSLSELSLQALTLILQTRLAAVA